MQHLDVEGHEPTRCTFSLLLSLFSLLRSLTTLLVGRPLRCLTILTVKLKLQTLGAFHQLLLFGHIGLKLSTRDEVASDSLEIVRPSVFLVTGRGSLKLVFAWSTNIGIVFHRRVLSGDGDSLVSVPNEVQVLGFNSGS